MGCILVGILAGAVFFAIARLVNFTEFFQCIVYALAFACVCYGLVLGTFFGTGNYGEPEMVSTVELVSLKDESVSVVTGHRYYVSVSETNSYTYYVKVNSPYASNSQQAYISKTIYGSNITIVEDDSYTDAKLVTYVRDAKSSFWTFAVTADKRYEYVFYVPTGTIARDVSLN